LTGQQDVSCSAERISTDKTPFWDPRFAGEPTGSRLGESSLIFQ
jgi:hypothetical protein